MKLSNVIDNKSKLIELIKGYFDTKIIEEISQKTKFVQRKSKLNSMIFFSVCVCK